MNDEIEGLDYEEMEHEGVVPIRNKFQAHHVIAKSLSQDFTCSFSQMPNIPANMNGGVFSKFRGYNAQFEIKVNYNGNLREICNNLKGLELKVPAVEQEFCRFYLLGWMAGVSDPACEVTEKEAQEFASRLLAVKKDADLTRPDNRNRDDPLNRIIGENYIVLPFAIFFNQTPSINKQINPLQQDRNSNSSSSDISKKLGDFVDVIYTEMQKYNVAKRSSNSLN